MGSPAEGVERLAAFFRGHAFSPHRHDTYAVGITTAGIQAFDYRGAGRRSRPGQVFVLHPDERHDGRAGDGAGFGYRIAYIDPALIRVALAGTAAGALPFLADPVSRDSALRAAVIELVSDQGDPADEIRMTGCLTALAGALARTAGQPQRATATVDAKAVAMARDLLAAEAPAKVTIEALETATGLTRWQLARQFRRAYGVSPYRFHLLRRLDRARGLIGSGESLAGAAQRASFADQAHLSRHFRRAYGLSPGQWRALALAADSGA